MSKKHSIFSRYISHIRRSSKHVQQIHAIVFSSAVTVLLALYILYFDYGFWRDQYINSNAIKEKQNIIEKSESPLEVLSNFSQEASRRFGSIKSGGSALLEGKKSYSNKDEFLSASSSASSSESRE